MLSPHLPNCDSSFHRRCQGCRDRSLQMWTIGECEIVLVHKLINTVIFENKEEQIPLGKKSFIRKQVFYERHSPNFYR